MTDSILTRVRLLLAAGALSMVGACGQAPETGANSAPAGGSPPATIAAPAEPAPPAAEPVAAAAAVEESAGTEAAPPASSAAPLGKEIVLAENASTDAGTAWQYKEGEHFNRLTSAQGTSSSAGKIEVAEVFAYSCVHCYNLEAVLSDWVKKLPADVSFVRIPVMWNPVNEMHGRVYYTAEALGKLDVINAAMFKAIHVENRPLTEEGPIREFFVQNGVSAEDFNKTFRSFGVESALKRAKDLTVRYRVKGTPLLVVAGKYTTDGPKIRSHQDLLAVTEELIQRERQRT